MQETRNQAQQQMVVQGVITIDKKGIAYFENIDQALFQGIDDVKENKRV